MRKVVYGLLIFSLFFVTGCVNLPFMGKGESNQTPVAPEKQVPEKQEPEKESVVQNQDVVIEPSKESETEIIIQDPVILEDTEKSNEKTSEIVEEKEPEIPENIQIAQKLQQLLAAGDIKGAIKLCEDSLDKFADDIEFKLMLASLYLSDGQYSKAISIANAVLEKDPQNKDAIEIKVFAARASGDKQSYNAVVKQVLDKDPFNASANIMQAEDYALNKKYKPARDSYRRALRSEPENTQALYGFALSSYFLDDIKTAKSYGEKVLEIEPENAPALALMGKINAEENNYTSATNYVLKALESDPYNYEYHLDLGMYYRNRNMNNDAIKAFERAVEIDNTYFLGYAYLAGLHDELGHYSDALKNYKMVIKTNPKYYYAYESIAILEYHMKNYSEAGKYFAKANEYNKTFSYQMMQAASYFKQKDTINAKKVLASLMKTLDRESMEYQMARFFNDSYSKNAETTLTQKIQKEDNSNKKGKMLYYMGLYYELNGFQEVANEYYARVSNLQAPMFFEYRFAEWSVGK